MSSGILLTVDFVRNVQTHYLIGIDQNHTGDVRYFDKAAAIRAISETNQSFNCGSSAGSNSIQCAIAAGAQMTDSAAHGLTSSSDFDQPCGVLFGHPCTSQASIPMLRRCPSSSLWGAPFTTDYRQS